MEKILIFGGGYIGQRCKGEWGDQAVLVTSKIHSIDDALDLLRYTKSDRVLNAAGVRGKPNVDWCELPENRHYTAFGNTALPIILAEACRKMGVYMLHAGSGCVYYGESPDPKGWKEDDFANPISYYSKSKYAADLALGSMPNVGVARLRVPLDDRPYPGNILDKLTSFKRVIDVKNSLSVLPDMIETFHQLLEKQGEGIFHVTNPGEIAYRTIIDWYKELVDPNHCNEWINEQELVQSGLAQILRSTNVLQSSRLEDIGITMRPIEVAAREAMEKWVKIRQITGDQPRS